MKHVEVVAVVVGAALLACGRAEYSAQYAIPNSNTVVGVQLTQSHPFLAEYDRVLFFGPAEGPFQRIALFPDTGGYTLVNLYKLDASTLIADTIGNQSYRIELDSDPGTPVLRNQPVESSTQFLGAFDFDKSREWRFIGAGDRPKRDIGKLYTNE